MIAQNDSQFSAEAFTNEKKAYTIPVIFKKTYSDQPIVGSQSPSKRNSQVEENPRFSKLDEKTPDRISGLESNRESIVFEKSTAKRNQENLFSSPAQEVPETYKEKYDKLNSQFVFF